MGRILDTNQCPFMADSRSPASSSEGLYWRKLTLKLGEAVAIYDPLQSFG